MTVSPGQFVRQHRLCAAMSHEDIALRIETLPPVSAARRAEWLRAIEADVLPVRTSTAVALHAIPELDIDLAAFAATIDAWLPSGGDPMLVRFVVAPTAERRR